MADILEDVKSNWVIIVFFCAMVVWYANVNSRLAKAEDSIDTNEAKESLILEKLNTVQIDVALIKGKLIK